MTVTVLLDPAQMPDQSQDQLDFDNKLSGLMRDLPTLGAEINTSTAQINAVAADVLAKTQTATAAAIAAAASFDATLSLGGASAFFSGKAYQKNDSAISQVNFQTYRRMSAGSGSVDPANDIANWRIVATNGAFEPQAVGGVDVDLARGRYFTKAIAGNTTFTFSNVPAGGYCFTLELAVTSGIASFPTSVRTADGRPVVLTSGRTHLLMFITANGGTTWRLAVAGNYVS